MSQGRHGPPRRAPALRGAAEALATIAAFLVGGLGLAALGRAAAAPEPYARAEMAPGLWLVDGFNVLCAGVLRGRERSAFWSDENRRRLLLRVARFEDADARVIVVFDGEAPGAPPEGGLPESVFASSADDWIVARVREEGALPVAVVTADRQLADRARHRGAEVVPPLRFLARCPEEAL